jgi:hypothetical protein
LLICYNSDKLKASESESLAGTGCLKKQKSSAEK